MPALLIDTSARLAYHLQKVSGCARPETGCREGEFEDLPAQTARVPCPSEEAVGASGCCCYDCFVIRWRFQLTLTENMYEPGIYGATGDRLPTLRASEAVAQGLPF